MSKHLHSVIAGMAGSVLTLILVLSCGGSGTVGQIDDDTIGDDDDAVGDDDVVGDDDSQPASEAAYGWYDATGALVVEHPELVYFDGTGYLWYIDGDTGGVSDRQQYVYFETNDCTGEGFVYRQTPRVPFRIMGDDDYYVRPDTLQSEDGCFASVDYGPDYGCVATPLCPYTVVPLNECVPPSPIEPPDFDWQGPLHPQVS